MRRPRRRYLIALMGTIAAAIPAIAAAGADGGPPPAVAVAPGPLGITAQPTREAYLFRIPLGDSQPDLVQVTVSGGALVIVKSTGSSDVREESSRDANSDRRSFRASSGSSRQRLPLPLDAQAARMTQTVVDGAILVRIPRRGAPAGDHSTRPAAPTAGRHTAPTQTP
ncbi:MAG TPA: Hsp20/alpha crystallin family protein [Lamprocystis sp. (in: g-proteobacteria)]|nr:Hsp20/alpha crystallin family protein [Lamprocystis sp. (in: g-proteobacteria)]